MEIDKKLKCLINCYSQIVKQTLNYDPGKKRWLRFLDEFCQEDFYENKLSLEKAKDLFKRHVKIVEIEPHSFCNRRCYFCTNFTINRQEKTIMFPEKTYEKILKDLAEINYDRQIRFSRYCEPLANEQTIKMINQAKKICPNSEIMIISNGDYLNKEMLNKLQKAGLNRLHVSIYLEKDSQWTIQRALKKIEEFRKRININVKKRYIDKNSIYEQFEFDGFSFGCNCVDYNIVGFDRGGAIKHLTQDNYIRATPCIQVFQNITIDYNGTVMPCCNLRSDDPEQKKLNLGNLLQDGNNIFSIYGSKTAIQWRRALAGFSEKKYPCTTCNQIVPAKRFEIRLRRKWKKYFNRLGFGELTC